MVNIDSESILVVYREKLLQDIVMTRDEQMAEFKKNLDARLAEHKRASLNSRQQGAYPMQRISRQQSRRRLIRT